MNTPGDRSGADPLPPPVATGQAALAWAVSSGRAAEVVERQRALRRRRRRRRFAVAAGGALGIVAGMLVWREQRTVPAAPSAVSGPTIVATPERRVLPDGSVVELKAGAGITVDFGGVARRVRLDSGEVHFQVAKDAARPFVVTAAGVEVQAVGTAFSVHLAAEAVDVLVTEGRVAVAREEATAGGRPAATVGAAQATAVATPPPFAAISVGAGERVVVPVAPPAVSPPPAALPVSAPEQARRLAWRVPRIELAGTPLREAIARFNAHAGNRLVLDPGLGDLQVSGVLRADDTESLLLLLRNEFAITAEVRPGGEVRLRRP
ncbi:MAG: hypothetical protein RLZZ15_254 [Verrucomicrobiota bacterium]|jgi:transmembrane sensor